MKKAVAASARARSWLIKSEPSDYSIDAMQQDKVTVWDGVRNAVARKHLKAMQKNDRLLFYHSSCRDVGVVGEVSVCREAYPDQADKTWVVVDVQYERHLQYISLDTMKWHKEGALSGLVLLQQPRLSVQPVSEEHYAFILSLCEDSAAEEDRAKAKRQRS